MTEGNLTTSAFIGVAMSAMMMIAIVGIPIYLFFIKPALEKRAKDSSTRTRNVVSSSNSSKDPSKVKKNLLLIDQNNMSVPVEDMQYLAKVLKPDSTHMDILFAILTTPENIEWSIQDLERSQAVYADRAEQDKKRNVSDKNKVKKVDFDDLLNDGGWADDDEQYEDKDDDAFVKAKQAEEERKAEMERLKQATGQAITLLEGIDDGVLGQKWVEKSLTAAGVWPPSDLRFIKNMTFDYQGKQLAPLDHPGLRRLLCMTVGRLNSLYLNGHPELLEAGSKKLIDQTYFKSSMEFRQRAAMILEAALRVGMMVRSSRLVITIIETTTMFKLGTIRDEKGITWFNGLMMKQYNILPRMNVKSNVIITPDCTDIVCGDIAEVQIESERPHAENFLRQKITMFQQQGIPPQVGLATYREGWWFLLRMKRIDGNTPVDSESLITPTLNQFNFDTNDINKFTNEKPEYRLITAWPMMIQNVAQKSGKIKIQFQAPNVPGKYRYTVFIKSQEFLDADQELSIDINVIDPKKAGREPKVPPKKEEQDDDDEEENKNKEQALEKQ